MPARSGEPPTLEGGPDAGSEREALIRVAAAAAGAHRLDQVLELAAEEARRALGAASLAVSRWEPEENLLRTLINVGNLGPEEKRYPENEVYPITPGTVVERLVLHGQPYFNSVGDPAADHDSVLLLERLGKDSEVAVPIVVEAETWGEVWASTLPGDRRFRSEDVRFLEAIAGQLAVAIGRAELFSRVSRLAYEDPLTGLANRRAVEERLERALARAQGRKAGVALLLCDLDNLKAINDERGHDAGDRALKRVGEALVAAAADQPGALVGRLSGDEFCVVLERRSAEQARAVGAAALQVLAGDRDVKISISCGAAAVQGASGSIKQLLRLADAAQYAAKRNGGGQVCTAAPGRAPLTDPGERRMLRGGADRRLADAVEELGAKLAREMSDEPPLDRLEAVAMTVSEAFNAAAWTVSYAPAGGSLVRSISNAASRDVRLQGVRYGLEGEIYGLDDYPATCELTDAGEGFFHCDCNDPDADPAECELLRELGYDSALVSAAADRDGVWLLELYGDAGSLDLRPGAASVATLTRAAVPPPRRNQGGRPDAEEQLARHRELLLALNRGMPACARPEELLELVVDELQRAFRPQVAAIFRLRPDGMAELAAYRSDHPLTAGWTQPGDAGLVGRCLRERAPVVVGDVRSEPEFRGRDRPLKVRSELDVPVLRGEEVWGVVNLESGEPDAFDAEDVRVVEGVAVQLAAALGRPPAS